MIKEFKNDHRFVFDLEFIFKRFQKLYISFILTL